MFCVTGSLLSTRKLCHSLGSSALGAACSGACSARARDSTSCRHTLLSIHPSVSAALCTDCLTMRSITPASVIINRVGPSSEHAWHASKLIVRAKPGTGKARTHCNKEVMPAAPSPAIPAHNRPGRLNGLNISQWKQLVRDIIKEGRSGAGTNPTDLFQPPSYVALRYIEIAAYSSVIGQC